MEIFPTATFPSLLHKKNTEIVFFCVQNTKNSILFYSALFVEAVVWYVLLSDSTYPVTKSLKLCLISNHANEIAIDIS